jgi:predicted secreted protein
MMSLEATKYRAYARECLRQAEAAEKPEARQKLIELSRVWTAAALNEVHYLRTNQAQSSA